MIGNARPTLFILLAAVGVVLMIACANVSTIARALDTARHPIGYVHTAAFITNGAVTRPPSAPVLPLPRGNPAVSFTRT